MAGLIAVSRNSLGAMHSISRDLEQSKKEVHAFQAQAKEQDRPIITISVTVTTTTTTIDMIYHYSYYCCDYVCYY